MKCVLHIGVEKTGSTAIQTCIYNQRARLSEQGFALSDLIGKPTNRKLVAYFQSQPDDYFKDRDLTTPERRDAFFEGFIDAFSNEIQERKREGHHTFIISSEHLHSRLREPEDIAKLKAFLDAHFSSIQVLCYLREQSAMRRSLYSTSVRNGLKVPIENFQLKIAPGVHYYDYSIFLDKWVDVFGHDATTIILFDPSKMPARDIRRDFLKHIGFDGYAELPLFDVRVNESLTLAQNVALRAINRAHPRYNAEGALSAIRIELRETMLERPALKVGKIADTLAPVIYDRFDSVNSDIGRRHLGLDGNPFARPVATTGEDNLDDDRLIALVERELRELMQSARENGFDEAALALLESEISKGRLL